MSLDFPWEISIPTCGFPFFFFSPCLPVWRKKAICGFNLLFGRRYHYWKWILFLLWGQEWNNFRWDNHLSNSYVLWYLWKIVRCSTNKFWMNFLNKNTILWVEKFQFHDMWCAWKQALIFNSLLRLEVLANMYNSRNQSKYFKMTSLNQVSLKSL